jgi:hypothetical protein
LDKTSEGSGNLAIGPENISMQLAMLPLCASAASGDHAPKLVRQAVQRQRHSGTAASPHRHREMNPPSRWPADLQRCRQQLGFIGENQ